MCADRDAMPAVVAEGERGMHGVRLDRRMEEPGAVVLVCSAGDRVQIAALLAREAHRVAVIAMTADGGEAVMPDLPDPFPGAMAPAGRPDLADAAPTREVLLRRVVEAQRPEPPVPPAFPEEDRPAWQSPYGPAGRRGKRR